jgi:hypothetical protein
MQKNGERWRKKERQAVGKARDEKREERGSKKLMRGGRVFLAGNGGQCHQIWVYYITIHAFLLKLAQKYRSCPHASADAHRSDEHLQTHKFRLFPGLSLLSPTLPPLRSSSFRPVAICLAPVARKPVQRQTTRFDLKLELTYLGDDRARWPLRSR